MEEPLISRAASLLEEELPIEEMHKRLYDGLIPDAGKIRTTNIYKDGFVFETASFLPDTMKLVGRMPEKTFEEIINKYIEMMIAHPFSEGNDFTLRIWLNACLKKNLNAMVDWSLISKEDYDSAIKRSAINPDILSMLLEGALTDDVENKESFMKSIKSSLHYE